MTSRYAHATGFVNAETLHAGQWSMRTQVCVVGSGAGGAVTAQVLSAAGLDVLVVEEGGHHTRADFKMREDTAYPMLYQDDAGRTTEDLSIAILQGRSVGGTTTINWTTCFRTPEPVVEHWRNVHQVGGFKHSDLIPHWEAMEQRLNIQQIPLSEINQNNKMLWDGCKKLGISVDLIRRNVKSCFKSGYCGMGCPIDAKQSMLVTLLPEAVANGAGVLSHCRIDRFEKGGPGFRLYGVLLGEDGRTPTGSTILIEADHLVLSGGAINTPALLLRSGYTGDGLVGRRTYLHPTIAQFGIFPQPIQGFYGAPQSVASHHFADRGSEVGFFLEAAPVHPMLSALASPGIGEMHRQAMSHLAYAGGHIALHIDGFHEEEPGGTVKLRKTSQAPVLDYKLPPRIWKAMRESTKVLARIQLAAGAQLSATPHDPPLRVTTEADIAKIDDLPFGPNKLTVFSAHVMGGCWMSDDPKKGVVRSSDGQLHGMAGVHVIDGSLFPTSLGVNPQLSIYGLSRLMATRLADEWKKA